MALFLAPNVTNFSNDVTALFVTQIRQRRHVFAPKCRAVRPDEFIITERQDRSVRPAR
jgi:hypothetical protein